VGLGPAGLARIVAGTDPANSASQRVLVEPGSAGRGISAATCPPRRRPRRRGLLRPPGDGPHG
jgi:hypothetical protein